MIKSVDIVESLVVSLVSQVGTKNFMVGLHNAFAHAKAINEAGEHIEDKELAKMFECFDCLIKIAKDL